MTEVRRTFHQELDQIRADMVRLAALVTETIPRGTDVLLANDLQGAQRLIEDDDMVDTLALDIEERCYQVLALQQPVAIDLRSLITAIRLTSEIERSGDLMVNVAKGARRIYGVEYDPRLRGLIERMSEEATRLFRLAIDAYVEGNASLAAALDDMDDGLDLIHKEYIQAIFESHHGGFIDLQAAVQLALIGRFYERIGDHAVNIGVRVEYMVTGWLPEHTGAARLQARQERLESEPTIDLASGTSNPDETGRADDVIVALAVIVALVAVVAVLAARIRSLGAHIEVQRRAAGQAAAMAEAERAEAAETHERLSQALDAIPQAVLMVDAEGEVVVQNRGAAAFADARHSDALVKAAIDDLLADARSGRGGSRPIDLFGPPRRTLVITATPLPDGAMVVVDDISERRRLEATRRDFVANISHELKTPVGAMGLLAETLLAEDDRQVAARLAERIVIEAFRLDRTIEDLLVLSRIEGEEVPLHEPVRAGVVAAEAVDRIWPAAEQAGIAVAIEDVDEDLAILGDRRQLVSALYNLLDNAVKYSDAGASVEVRVGRAGDGVVIEVQDHGIGIPKADLARVFERFYRVDQARSRTTGGTGLGLAIVRHVATNHAGEVRVESRLGEGSTFTLVLPAAAVEPRPSLVTARANKG